MFKVELGIGVENIFLECPAIGKAFFEPFPPADIGFDILPERRVDLVKVDDKVVVATFHGVGVTIHKTADNTAERMNLYLHSIPEIGGEFFVECNE